MSSAIIEIQHYSFSIGRQQILRDVSLTVEQGENVSIVGPNGAGKTTLLKCLDRIVTGGKGRIRVNSRPLENYSQKELAKTISYVPQADGRSFPYTVYEFVLMGRYPYLSPFSSTRSVDGEAVREALVQTGTEEFSERPLKTLSAGERQKVFIAAALAQETKILLLDEPATFLDPKHQADIYRVLQRLNRKRNVTILSASHDINSAVLTSNRILALKGGAVAACGSPRQIMTVETLDHIYEKRFLLVKHPQTGLPMAIPEVGES